MLVVLSIAKKNLYKSTYFSLGAEAEVGLRLLKAFNHLVFIDDELAIESFLSARGDVGSDFPKNNSFCK